jgi:hypothetical protein
MRKTDLFRKPHFKGDDFPTPRAFTIAGVREVEVFIPNANAKERRWVVTVKEDSRYIFLSETLFDNIVAATGCEDTNDWPGQAIQVYRDRVNVRGEARWGVRARRAGPELAVGEKASGRKLPAPITDTTPRRPYPPQTLQQGFAQQRDPMPSGWKAAVVPKGVRIRVCIGFKAMFPDFSASEVAEARHALCSYLCEGRERLSENAGKRLSWADGKALNKWLFTGELNPDGHDTPCELAAEEAHAILAFVGFWDLQHHADDAEEEAEQPVDAAVQEAVEMLGAVVAEKAPPQKEDDNEIP